MKTHQDSVVRLLNEALAGEIICVLRYQRHHVMATDIHAQAVARELLAYANEEGRHADLIAARITQLGGPLFFSTEGLTLRSVECPERRDLIEMIREDLVAERIGVEAYREMIGCVGDDDPTSRRLLEEILVNEEEHAGDLAALIDILTHDEQISSTGHRGFVPLTSRQR